MKIALLVCDHVADEYVEKFGTYVDMFEKLFPNFNIQPYFIIDYFFPVVDDYDVFICTGSKSSVYDRDPWIPHLLELIREIDSKNKKFVGVCFGHQAIAEALGGKVEKADVGYLIGVHEFQIAEQKGWMNGVSSYHLLMLCQDQVKILPENSTILASSEYCPCAMFTVGNNIIGIQGHPEFSQEYDRAVFENRLRKVSPEKVEKAIESLNTPHDGALIAQWIERFCALS
ncbi:MAG: amidotransferase [Cyclobacteriaceae bacterium]